MIRIAMKTLVTAVLALGMAVGLWACASYGPSEAGKPTAAGPSGEVDPQAQLAYAEAPKIYNEAPTPEGWPALTPVDEIRIKHYPAYRAAVIEAGEQGGTDSGMFRPLFNHIKRQDIAMTAPVEMTYNQDGRQSMMAFLYRTPEMGATGSDNADQRVQVRDIPAATALSIGLKGSYNHDNFVEAVDKLNAWLKDSDAWQAAGEPRYLGYNSPFVPSWSRYGEVQIPVQAMP